MTDPLRLLRDADPAARLSVPEAPPPRELLEQIVATPRPRRRAPRRMPVAIATGAVAVAALVGVLAPGERSDLAARAYAATTPGEQVLYTELSSAQAIPGRGVARTLHRIWQRGDQSRRISTQLRERGGPLVSEYVLDGGVLRARLPGGEIQTVHTGRSDGGRDPLETERTSFVDRFRARYADAELRDAGRATFDGRPARAYELLGGTEGVRETYYLQPQTGMPMGSVISLPVYDPERRGRRVGQVRATETLRKFERLPATPENLSQLTAPWAAGAHPR